MIYLQNASPNIHLPNAMLPNCCCIGRMRSEKTYTANFMIIYPQGL